MNIVAFLFQKLIQATSSVGGHFQFKHEKSWDNSTAPSLYDKYFEINMDNLSTAISTVPFFERNDINQSLFSETDLLSMNNRASKYKLKYFNDKAYFTPESNAQDSILKSLCSKEKTNSTEFGKLLKENAVDEYIINLDMNVIKTDVDTSLNIIEQDSKPKVNDTVDDFDDENSFEYQLQDENISKSIIDKITAEAENNTVSPKQSDLINNTAPNIVDSSTKAAETKPKEGVLTKGNLFYFKIKHESRNE